MLYLFVHLYGEIIPDIDRTGAQIMFYLTCTIKSSVDLAHYGLSRAKDWVSVVVVVALLFYVHGKHLRSCRYGQLI